MLTAREVAEKIESEFHNKQYDAAEVEPNFHSALVKELLARGWDYKKLLWEIDTPIDNLLADEARDSHMIKNDNHIDIIKVPGGFYRVYCYYRVR